jgi:hypothetical protein
MTPAAWGAFLGGNRSTVLPNAPGTMSCFEDLRREVGDPRHPGHLEMDYVVTVDLFES